MQHFDRELFQARLIHAANGYTLQEVAAASGVSTATLSRLERGGMPDLPTFFALCAWMKARPDAFMVDPPIDRGVPFNCPTCERLRRAMRDVREIVGEELER
jgi:transcriptional regulator with XRE-family HTH domain